MALISSESMILMVNGTLQSEFFTMFWPMRFTYSTTTGSVMNLVLFSISSAYILPILISVSTEYQLPKPRAPMSRFPTALTSSMLPGFTLIIWLPGSTTLSGFTPLVLLVAGVSPPTGVVPGAGLLAGVSPPTDAVPGAGCAAGVVDGVPLPVCAGVLFPAAGVLLAACAVPVEDCLAGLAAVASPPTGVVPGAGCAAGVEAGVVVVPVDCAPSPADSASANPASDPALKPVQRSPLPFQAVLMTPTSSTAPRTCRFAPLYRR